MSRGGFKITRCSDQHEDPGRSADSNLPSWMNNFAAKSEEFVKAEEDRQKAAVTVVDHARERQDSIYNQMYSIMNGNNSRYSSVEEAVNDYQKKTGLTEHLEQVNAQLSEQEAADLILSASENLEDVAEKKTPENGRPVIYDKIEGVEAFIEQMAKKRPGLSVPEAQYLLAQNYEGFEGVDQEDFEDPELEKVIDVKLEQFAPKRNEPSALTHNILDAEVEPENDAFELLRPGKN